MTFTGDVPISGQRDLAADVEAAGLSSLWANDGYGRDPFLLCQAWADATERLTVGLGVAQIPTRTPAQLGKAAVTLQEASAGRFVLGLGVSQPQALERWHGVTSGPPLATARDALAIVRAVVAGETTDHHGDVSRSHGFRLEVSPLPPPVPLYLGAMKPRMLSLAGEAADGVLLSWESPVAVAHAADRVAAAAAAAGRGRPSIAVYLRVAIEADRSAARRVLADEVAAFWTYYAEHLAAQAPDPDAVRAATAAAGVGREALARSFSDELLFTVGWYGLPDDDLGPLLTSYRAAGADHLIVRPLTAGDPRAALGHVTAALAASGYE
ncbi:MAG TPA: LLM class flavin-dependent oxidoreductase [Solirubrobacteraceae bacterium]|nr:LLM class flavin-dependent oxidoreductase [Solirubrobacteraceae bacterium]